MANFGKTVVNRLMLLFKKAMSTSLLILVFIILQYILDIDFQCSCTPDWHLDFLYFGVPPVILTWVLVYIESYYQPRLCDSCTNCWSNVLQVVPKTISVFAIWSTTVLFDGEWYFCHETKSDPKYIMLPCKDLKNLTTEEKLVRNGYKIKSLNIGMGLLCGFIVLWTLWMCFQRCIEYKSHQADKQQDCCKAGLKICLEAGLKSCRDVCCPPYYKVVYENLLAEQVREHLKEELTKLAEKRAKDICRPHLDNIRNQTRQNGASDPWHEISSSYFYMQNERPENQEENMRPGNQGRQNVVVERDRDGLQLDERANASERTHLLSS